MKTSLPAWVRLLLQRRPKEPDDLDDELEELDLEEHESKAERAERRAMERKKLQQFLAEHPNHPTVEQIVDDRVLLLGLDQMYRERMKRHESTELLACARAVATTLDVSPRDVPLESYYGQSKRLAEYFRLMRGLQAVDRNHRDRVSDMREFKRLLSVMSAPIYGRSVKGHGLFPTGRDPLVQALEDASVHADESQWTLGNFVERAHRVAVETQDFSLVGLAAVARDAVVLAALRESVALYGAVAAMSMEPPARLYVWRVDEELARRATLFVTAFNELFDEDLPEPVAENGDLFFEAADENYVNGRCICIGKTERPTRFYHWAVYKGADGDPAVEEFWDTEIWTTDRYRRRVRA